MDFKERLLNRLKRLDSLKYQAELAIMIMRNTSEHYQAIRMPQLNAQLERVNKRIERWSLIYAEYARGTDNIALYR